MFCASITCKALHSLVTRYFTRTPARPGKTRGTRFAEAGKQHPQRGGVERGGKFLVRSQVEARALRGHRGLPAGQSGGGWEGARPAGAGPVLAPQGSAHVRRAGWGPRAGASRFPDRHGAADVARRQRGGRGRVRGVPEVRRWLRGARRPRAGPVPLAGGALEAREGPAPVAGGALEAQAGAQRWLAWAPGIPSRAGGGSLH